jgi:hypothetical protein
MTKRHLPARASVPAPGELCNPSSETIEAKFCTASIDQVCEEKLTVMQYQCDACGGLSSDAEHLCNPKKIH